MCEEPVALRRVRPVHDNLRHVSRSKLTGFSGPRSIVQDGGEGPG